MQSDCNKVPRILIALSIVGAVQIITANTAANANSRVHKISENNDSHYMQDGVRTAKARKMQLFLDENVKPCDDFYEFSCSKFPRFYPAQPGVPTNIFKIMDNALTQKIRTILNAPDSADDTALDRKVKHFYASCTKLTELSQAEYRAKLLTIIAEFGKMPVLSGNKDWDEQNFDWIEMAAKMQRRYARPALLQLDMAADYRNTSINCMYVGQPKMILDSKALYNENSTAAIRQEIVSSITHRLATFLGVPQELARTTADDIMTFEIVLSHGLWDGKMETELMNLPVTIEELQKNYAPVIDMERFINLTVGPVSTACLYESVKSFQSNLLRTLPHVPKYVVANYLFYMLIHDDFIMPRASKESEQRELCAEKVKTYFNKALDNIIYRHSDTANIEADIQFIYEKLKLSLRNLFLGQELDWMNEKTRMNAIKKLDRTRFEINSYDQDNSTTAEFDDLNVNSNDYLANVRNYYLLQGRKFVRSIYELPKQVDVGAVVSFTPANIIRENKIIVPVSMLQPYILWAASYPNSLKFGNIGALLGHELLHSFDDEGRKLDEYGNQYNWWDIDSIMAFNERKKCFVQQYSQYKHGANYVRGDFVLSENIADNGGLKLAYDAYMLWYNQTSDFADLIKREKFTQLGYTPAQLFFISFAQLWCSDQCEIDKNDQVARDTHSPNMYRVIGSLRNSKEFSATFNCPLRSPMNPVEKCKLY